MAFEINYLAVLGAAVVSIVLGMIWYSPGVFGKAWMAGIGLGEERMNQLKARGMGRIYALAFLGSFIMAYVLAHFVAIWGVSDVFESFQLAFWTWLGFVATTMLGQVLWEGKTFKVYLINSVYYLAAIYLMTLVFVLWP